MQKAPHCPWSRSVSSQGNLFPWTEGGWVDSLPRFPSGGKGGKLVQVLASNPWRWGWGGPFTTAGSGPTPKPIKAMPPMWAPPNQECLRMGWSQPGRWQQVAFSGHLWAWGQQEPWHQETYPGPWVLMCCQPRASHPTSPGTWVRRPSSFVMKVARDHKRCKCDRRGNSQRRHLPYLTTMDSPL